MNLNNINRKLSILFVGTLMLLYIFYILAKNINQFQVSPIYYLSCNTTQDNYPRLATSTNLKKYNIFFLETNKERQFLNIRAQCAIESAALNNPNANVYLYSLKAKFDQNTTNLTKNYANIKLIDLEPHKVFENTYFEDWWNNNKSILLNGNHPIEHLSDGLRLALVYKFGGVYSDLDTITIKSFETFIDQSQSGPCCSNAETLNPVEINNAFLLFTKQHIVLEKFIKNFVDNYKPYEWGANGPSLIMRVLDKECNIKLDDCSKNLSPRDRVISSKCGNMTLFPFYFFYPITWTQANDLFKNNSSLPIRLFLNSYSVHFFGAITKMLKVYQNSNNIYEFFAIRHCPVTYAKIATNPNEYF